MKVVGLSLQSGRSRTGKLYHSIYTKRIFCSSKHIVDRE